MPSKLPFKNNKFGLLIESGDFGERLHELCSCKGTLFFEEGLWIVQKFMMTKLMFELTHDIAIHTKTDTQSYIRPGNAYQNCVTSTIPYKKIVLYNPIFKS